MSRPTAQQIEFAKVAATKDLRLICEAWPAAVADAAAIGYGTGTGGEHVGLSDTPDPTGDRAMRRDDASGWLRDARGTLVLILRLGHSEARGERRWTGPFDPPLLVGSVCGATEDLIDLQPLRIDHLLRRISRLASLAGKHWPPTPSPGDTITVGGETITVGKRTVKIEMCTECKAPIAGGAADPLARIDGRPYHRTPCYNTVGQRRRRRVTRAS